MFARTSALVFSPQWYVKEVKQRLTLCMNSSSFYVRHVVSFYDCEFNFSPVARAFFLNARTC